jgi:mannitol/fructose-specific phosphotransferase system IIA component (Ntr-type)
MLIDYIKNADLIRCKVEVNDWEDAIIKGCELLESEGFITENYVHSIIEMTKEHGPYFVLTPKVAMPHSRPEAGVIKKGISIMTLKEPIEFGSPDNDPVTIVITLAATDNKTHLGLMQDIVELLTYEENIKNLEQADSIEDIKKILS